MCGICGIYEYQRRDPVDQGTLAAMAEVLRHRGPDEGGLHLDGDLGIGARRLSIIDLPGAHQPIRNEDGSIVLVFNGEIYNYRDLRERLLARGHRLATHGDGEVIVHLYEDLGDELVHELRGMFGFALWDARRRRLLVVRDRLGIKPVYYSEADGRFVFGSEIKALLQHPAVQARPNLLALRQFLTLKYAPAPQTMFEGICSLPPGHLVVCDEHGVKERAYWDVSFAQDATSGVPEAELTERLEELLREAVQMHLMSDVPFGAFLSGGVDSSLIVALMSEFLHEPVKTFSVGFTGDGAAVSELPYARIVAERFNTDHHELIIEPHHFADLAETLIWHLDQPIGDESTLANYMVAALASRHVKMVLTGEGGDELFAGYARYPGERFSPLFRWIPGPAKSAALALASRLPGLRRPRLALYALCQKDEAQRLANWFPLFNEEMVAELLDESVKQGLDGTGARDVFAAHLSRTDARDPISRLLYLDTKLWLPDDLLLRGDKTSMASSLEARVPLLDHVLVEFAASLPANLKLRRLTRKYLLKQVGRRLLPAEIIDRKKAGFSMPMTHWFRKESREFVRDLLSAETLARRGLFDASYVERILGAHESGFEDRVGEIWGLVAVELWFRLFIDSARPAAPARVAA